MLEDNQVYHFEESCSYLGVGVDGEVAAALNLDVAGGE